MKELVLLLDNYDSFTYNLAQYLEELGASVVVYRNDEIDIPGIQKISPSHLVVSPGPGVPENAGISCQAVSSLVGKIPILGVCLGHQVIGQIMGAKVIRGVVPVHGKTSSISHDSRTIFSGIPNPFVATRYHSLILERESIPECLEVSSSDEEGVVMSIRHRDLPLEGVQFHPESILTRDGHKILENFLKIKA